MFKCNQPQSVPSMYRHYIQLTKPNIWFSLKNIFMVIFEKPRQSFKARVQYFEKHFLPYQLFCWELDEKINTVQTREWYQSSHLTLSKKKRIRAFFPKWWTIALTTLTTPMKVFLESSYTLPTIWIKIFCLLHDKKGFQPVFQVAPLFLNPNKDGSWKCLRTIYLYY